MKSKEHLLRTPFAAPLGEVNFWQLGGNVEFKAFRPSEAFLRFALSKNHH
jgi:hypothetical protein